MKRRSILFICSVQLLLCSIQAHSQVWNGDLRFTSQLEIDNFTAANYTSVNGNLKIEDNGDGQHDIINLAGLAGLTSVSGTVSINSNNLLTNTIYLNLITVGGLSISNNPALTTINGLPLISVSTEISIQSNAALITISAFNTLSSIGGQLIISENPQLTNLAGFSNLTSVVGGPTIIQNNNSLANLDVFSNLSEATGLIIRNNPALTNINGLGALIHLGFLEIRDNLILPDINGLHSLTTVLNYIRIISNPSLQNITGLSNLVVPNGASFGPSIDIWNNNALETINGAAGITSLSSMIIENNPSLNSISGFSGLRRSGGIQILSNRAMTSISGFNVLDSILGNLHLEQSNSLTALNAFDNLSHIAGRFYCVNNYILGNISPMNQLTSIGGELRILLDTLLENMDFLPNLRSIGGLLISSNDRLININGFSNLQSVNGGDLMISLNPKLTSIGGLSNIRSIGGRLVISQLDELINLQGLQNITRVGTDLQISSMPRLTNLDQLKSIDSVGRDLNISYNPVLTNLNGLRFLRKTAFVNVQRNDALAEFCGLYGLYVDGGPTLGTSINQNLANPTPQEIINGGPCAIIPVPLTLIAFNLKCESNKIILNWITTDEYNSSHFALQRSSDGISWTNLKIIQTANTIGENKYSFTDMQPLAESFYRLAQYDIDGKLHYSSILKSACTVQDSFTLWPNPATDKVFINISSANASDGLLRLFDSKGRWLKSKRLIILPGLNQFELNVAGIAQGMYIVEVSNQAGTLKQKRLLLKK